MKFINSIKKIKKIIFVKNCSHIQEGFTLVEALIAISILMIAMASPMTMAQKSLTSSMFARDQMIASFLAQDAIEGVKNIRDQDALNAVSGNTNWLSNLDDCICISDCDFDNVGTAVKSCDIDTTLIGGSTSFIKSFSSGILPINAVYVDSDGNQVFQRFSFSSGIPTKFKRALNIKLDPSGDGNLNEAKVHARVFWDSAMGQKRVDITFFMYNYENGFK